MRIKSSFHDYYDGVQSHGQDQELLYLRYPKTIPISDRKRYYYHWCTHIDYRPIYVGFCGSIYTMLQFRKYMDTDWINCWSIEDVDKFYQKHANKKEQKEYMTKRAGHKRYVWRMSNRDQYIKSWKELQEKSKEYLQYFEEHKCPVFIIGYRNSKLTLRTNGSLKSTDFQRMIDPYTAYQEISMYLGNIAQPEKHIPEVSDKDMITAKGFDKYSFRKDPTKRNKKQLE
jgi:hypothetical protein